MSKRVAGLVLSLMLALAMLDPAGATTFNVPAGDVATLVANINAANNEALNPGADTIVLADGNYDLTAINNYWYGPAGLPPIRSDITIRNNGNGATIRRTGGPNFRLFYVSGGNASVGPSGAGTLTLINLTLTGGFARGGDGGASRKPAGASGRSAPTGARKPAARSGEKPAHKSGQKPFKTLSGPAGARSRKPGPGAGRR